MIHPLSSILPGGKEFFKTAAYGAIPASAVSSPEEDRMVAHLRRISFSAA